VREPSDEVLCHYTTTTSPRHCGRPLQRD
jgi:hypothetical protein